MKKTLLICALIFSTTFFIAACSGGDDNNNTPQPEVNTETTDNGNPSYDPNRGEGKFHNVELGDKLDVEMAAKGKKISELKCESCHKMTDERLVGPGWKGVTTRHRPEWIMNFMTNTDEMIDKDPKAQAMLEICMVRMPNQNLTDDEAREILEFMRQNDGVK